MPRRSARTRISAMPAACASGTPTWAKRSARRASNSRWSTTPTAGSVVVVIASSAPLAVQAHELVGQRPAVGDTAGLELGAGQGAVGHNRDRRPQAELLLQLVAHREPELGSALHLDEQFVERARPHHLDPELALAAPGPHRLLDGRRIDVLAPDHQHVVGPA